MTRSRRSPAARVYAAHPLTCYATPHAAICLAALHNVLPGTEVIDPEHTGWDDNDDWLHAWPDLLGTLTGLVVFAATDGTIGTGCISEVNDAITIGLPVAAFDFQLGLVELAGTALLPAANRTAQRAAWLAYGPRVDPRILTQRAGLRVAR